MVVPIYPPYKISAAPHDINNCMITSLVDPCPRYFKFNMYYVIILKHNCFGLLVVRFPYLLSMNFRDLILCKYNICICYAFYLFQLPLLEHNILKIICLFIDASTRDDLRSEPFFGKNVNPPFLDKLWRIVISCTIERLKGSVGKW